MEGKAIIAVRLRAAREALGISQKQLGIRAGIDEFTASARINQYERGKHLPDLLTAQRLAHELGVPVSFLFEPDDDLATLLRLVGPLSKDRLRALITTLGGNAG
ncbi:helix-turn-helix transcriptional regulator [Niveibacterium sp. 24ML]|uniref:helix-turn-helix transcriptional regulator n=1 Tax=Niveibacterium sp. 24ML TaxID=2985512 RepID=UPI00226E72C1|nr:helix-turn-helix transcriptional regulator [Niveibacterium sp. 24ML]MCX9158037.1 helix-turn-helix transcriptional regulator [Niveibacterium sp. 24ML]